MAATSPYDDLTPESIKEEMLEGLTVNGEEIDTREGSYANTLVSVAAYQIWKLYQQFPALLSMVFPDETAGEYIDKNAEQIGMVRSAGRKASVSVTFTGKNGTRIPKGTALYAPDSGLQFLTAEDAVIQSGSAGVQAEAAEVGIAYNLPAKRITSLYINLSGVDTVTNSQAASGGADPESDAAFYARYHDRRVLPITSGNRYHYITWATEVPGVSYAGCVPLWDGPGTVKVVIAGADRKAVGEPIIAACAAHIEEVRPIGAAVTVVSVTKRTIPMTAAVTLIQGATLTDVRDQLRKEVGTLMSQLEFGVNTEVPFSRFLACLLQCQGVANYSEFTVDGGTGAVTINAEESPEVGSLRITETEA